eukprot:scaffold6216_cov149-Amphora_coffeaeformis.AAC.4
MVSTTKEEKNISGNHQLMQAGRIARQHKDSLRAILDRLARPLRFVCKCRLGLTEKPSQQQRFETCRDAGWSGDEIVVHGPDKWYNTVEGCISSRIEELVGSIFADSLAESKTIVRHSLDKEDGFSC